MVIKLCRARVDLCGGVIGVGKLTRVLERNIGIQFTFKLLIFKLFLCCFYSWRLVCTLPIFFFCKRPKLENLIYITFVHVSLISLKLKISSSIIYHRRGKKFNV